MNHTHRRHRMSARFGPRYPRPTMTITITPDMSRLIDALNAATISADAAGHAFAEMERQLRLDEALRAAAPELVRLRGGLHV